MDGLTMSEDEQTLKEAIDAHAIEMAMANQALLRVCAFRLMSDGHSPAALAAALKAETARYRERAQAAIATHEKAAGAAISGTIQ